MAKGGDDNNSNSNSGSNSGSNKEKEKNQTLVAQKESERQTAKDTAQKKQKQLIAFAFVVVLLGAGVYFWGFAPSKWGSSSHKRGKNDKSKNKIKDRRGSGDKHTAKQKKVRWADQEGAEDAYADRDNSGGDGDGDEGGGEGVEEHMQARQSAEMRAFEEQEARMRRLKHGEAIENVLTRTDNKKEEFARNERELQKCEDKINGNNNNDVGHDSQLTAMENEQSFDTAFKMKSDIDEEKDGAKAYMKHLIGRQKIIHGEQAKMHHDFQVMQQEYGASYGVHYTPRRVEEGRARAAYAQQHARARAEQERARGENAAEMHARAQAQERAAAEAQAAALYAS